MTGNYSKIVQENIRMLFKNPKIKSLEFQAFGMNCVIHPEGIFLKGKKEEGVLGILISLYALHAGSEEMILEPFKAFKDLPNSAPYVVAFAARTQQVLVPHVEAIRMTRESFLRRLSGSPGPPSVGGDFSFVVQPFPKIALCYIFYRADEDFPASAICLFSNNALSFAPIDALADTAEYMSKSILEALP
jgi:hypothetical protein